MNNENEQNMEYLSSQQINPQQQKKEDRKEAGEKAAKVALKGVGNSLVPGVGGKVVDIAVNTKLGQKVIEKGGKQLNRIPGMGKKLDKLNKSGAIDTADQAVDMLGGGKIASQTQSNRMNPGSNLQGVKKPSTFNTSDSTKNTTDGTSATNKSNASFDNSTDSSGDNKAVDVIKKHPLMTLKFVGIIFGLVIFFLIIISLIASTAALAKGVKDAFSGDSNTSSTTNTSITDSCTQISVPLSEFLESKGTSIEDYNQYIVNEVRKAGVSTRAGVVAAAVTLVDGLCQNYQARLPYTMGGAHPPDFFGAKDYWGKSINGGAGEYRHGYGPYFYEGPDCSGFVNWAIYNGGYKVSEMAADSFGSYGPTSSPSAFKGQAGDVLYNEHHVVLIVGESGDNYLIAEASSGENGTRITTVPKNTSTYSIVDMTSFYSNSGNFLDNYPEAKESSLDSTSSNTTSTNEAASSTKDFLNENDNLTDKNE